ncbi:MAG: A/G-specific adenine glycosylase, partial [Actinomycetota bacterium]|nr:A/G-specific adenine glycosylase [Actinomycetota bacterium]
PDPATGSAGAGRPQSDFAGSDRQGRGRLVDALRRGTVPWGHVPAAAGWEHDPGRARRVADALVADGLAVADAGGLRLP